MKRLASKDYIELRASKSVFDSLGEKIKLVNERTKMYVSKESLGMLSINILSNKKALLLLRHVIITRFQCLQFIRNNHPDSCRHMYTHS